MLKRCGAFRESGAPCREYCSNSSCSILGRYCVNLSLCPGGSVVSATKITLDKMKQFSRIAKVENQRFWACLAKGMKGTKISSQVMK